MFKEIAIGDKLKKRNNVLVVFLATWEKSTVGPLNHFALNVIMCIDCVQRFDSIRFSRLHVLVIALYTNIIMHLLNNH